MKGQWDVQGYSTYHASGLLQPGEGEALWALQSNLPLLNSRSPRRQSQDFHRCARQRDERGGSKLKEEKLILDVKGKLFPHGTVQRAEGCPGRLHVCGFLGDFQENKGIEKALGHMF